MDCSSLVDTSQTNATKPVLVVLGPTAVGKTELAIHLARRFNGEILSQDSRQIYRHMDIGTAKPTPEERALVPHHGLDLVDPDQTWTLAQQQRLTYDCIDRLHSLGRLPVLVGGTGQYLRAIIEGWRIPEVPPSLEIRQRLEAEGAEAGAPALHNRLWGIDPASASKIMPNDLRRIVRALEVWEVTGRPLSEQQGSEPPPYGFALLGLTMPREALYERIDRRADRMVQRGLLDEIERLLGMGYGWNLASMRTIGYGEFQPWFEGREQLEDCVRQLKFDTHDFARRQYVWFRRFKDVRWLDAGSDSLRADAEAFVLSHFS